MVVSGLDGRVDGGQSGGSLTVGPCTEKMGL